MRKAARDTKIDKQWDERDRDEHFHSSEIHFFFFLSDTAPICCASFVSFYVFSAIMHCTSWMCDAHSVNNKAPDEEKRGEIGRDYCTLRKKKKKTSQAV